MSVNINIVVLAGNLTETPKVKSVPSGSAVCQLSLAVGRQSKTGESSTDFFDIEVWGKTAEVCGEFLVKGSTVLVQGRLRLDRWKANDGTNRSKIIVVAESVDFLDRPGSRETKPAADCEVPF